METRKENFKQQFEKFHGELVQFTNNLYTTLQPPREVSSHMAQLATDLNKKHDNELSSSYLKISKHLLGISDDLFTSIKKSEEANGLIKQMFDNLYVNFDKFNDKQLNDCVDDLNKVITEQRKSLRFIAENIFRFNDSVSEALEKIKTAFNNAINKLSSEVA